MKGLMASVRNYLTIPCDNYNLEALAEIWGEKKLHFIIIAVIILLDQISKYLIFSNMSLYESIPVIERVFHITYTQNYGAAFSILQNQRGLFIGISSIAVIIIFYILVRYYKQHHVMFLYSLSLIAAGALGNLIDRIRLGFVVDFFDLRVWPVFNIADISIVSGTLLLGLYILWIEPKGKVEGKDE